MQFEDDADFRKRVRRKQIAIVNLRGAHHHGRIKQADSRRSQEAGPFRQWMPTAIASLSAKGK
jgi:hypothetical protein